MNCTNVVLYTPANGPSVTYAWMRTPPAIDNVAVAGRFCSGGPANDVFTFHNGSPLNITCYAWDPSGNNNTCSYSVIVYDNIPPSITCPADAHINTTTGQPYGNYNWPLPTVSDNVAIQAGSLQCSALPNANTPVGTHSISCTVHDTSNNVNSCSFTITVTDKEPPQVTCPLSLRLNATSLGSTATTTLAISATDNTKLQSITCSGGYPTVTYEVGTTPVTCTAADVYNNVRQCSFDVTVVDVTPPVLLCSSSSVDTVPNNDYGLLPSYVAYAKDNVNVTSLLCTPGNDGSFHFPFGTTHAVCIASDAAGNTASCSINVTVIDNQPPTVACQSPTAIATSLSSNILVNFTYPLVTDNVALSTEFASYTINSITYTLPHGVSQFTIPTYATIIMNFFANDTSGNINSACSWPITVYPKAQVRDTIPPVIHNCLTPFLFYSTPSSDPTSSMYNSSVYTIVTTALPNKRYALVSWPILNATDTLPVVTSYLSWSPSLISASHNGLSVGNYVVAYSAVDSQGNTAYCVFRVVVRDTQPPSFINCPNSATYYTYDSPGAVPTAWPAQGISATDNFNIPNPYGTCVSSPVGQCPPPGYAITTPLPLGTTSFTYNAVDSSGNRATPCEFSITVVDNWPPTLIGCSTNLIAAQTSPGLPTADIAGLCPAITATDNIHVQSITYASTPAGYNCSTPVPITYSTGITITVTATDEASNTAECFLIITVADNEKPVLHGCRSTQDTLLSYDTDVNKSTAEVFLPNIYASDNSGSVR